MDALLVIFISALLSMFVALAKKPAIVFAIATLGLATAIGLLVNQWFHPYSLFSYEGVHFDQHAIAYGIVALFFGLLIVIGGYNHFKADLDHTGDYIALILFSLTGGLIMLSFTDFFLFFLGLEILSIPVYVLAGSKKGSLISSEAALKYFFTGSFATGILLFGIAWIYGATGTFNLQEISQVLEQGTADPALLSIGILILMAAFLFKVGAAPFHFWSPDVYHGSPSIFTGFMAAVVKLAGFGAFYRLFAGTFASEADFWGPALSIVAVLTILVGNLSALRQTKFKRLLAYSSITHVGYSLLAILVIDVTSDFNLWTYLFSYGFSIIGLIIVSMVLNDEQDEISNFKGIARRNPFVGFVLILALLSLAGLPPLVGFFGKFLVFSNAIESYPVLVIIALINSAIGMYYYLRLVILSVSKSDDVASEKLTPSIGQYLVLAICALAILLGGNIVLI